MNVATRSQSMGAIFEALEKQKSEPEPAAAARFIEGGYFATPGSLRDTDDFSTLCLLDVDLDEARRRHDMRKPIDGFVVPVPRGAVMKIARPHWLPSFYGIADGRCYDDRAGFIPEQGDKK